MIQKKKASGSCGGRPDADEDVAQTSLACCNLIIPPNLRFVNSQRADLLILADKCLTQAAAFRAEWLRSGDAQSWRLWRACLQDRAALLGEVGR